MFSDRCTLQVERVSLVDERATRAMSLIFRFMTNVCCWIATHGEEQRWGNVLTGRYQTDWNCASLECLQDDGLQPLRADEFGQALSHDMIVGVAQIKADMIYHALALLDAGQRKQYQFWQSVFGGDCLQNALYYFGVSNFIRFRMPVKLPVTEHRRLVTFFAHLDIYSPGSLIQQLESEGNEIPEWLTADDYLVVRLPGAAALQIARQRWSSFALPDPSRENLISVGVRVRKRMIGWKFISKLANDFVLAPEHRDEPPGQGRFSAEFAGEVAEVIRVLVAGSQGGAMMAINADFLQKCSRAAFLLQQLHDDMDLATMSRRIVQSRGKVCTARLPYRASFIIQCLLLSGFLRDSSDLQEVVIRAVRLVLPETLGHAVLQSLEGSDSASGQKLKLPSAAKVSRARFAADVAYMLHCRNMNQEAERAGGLTRYVMVDSSVQGHYDFELIRVTSLRTNQLGEMFSLALQLCSLWNDVVESLAINAEESSVSEMIAKALVEETELHALLQTGIDVQQLPAVVVGSGHATLYHKLHATMHAMWLHTGSALRLETYTRSIFAIISDQGTEFSLHRIQPMLVRELFPWIPHANAAPNEHDWAPCLADEMEMGAKVDLSNSNGIAGLLHIMHNSTMDLGRSMVTFDETVKSMSHLSKMLSRKDPKARLLQACFSDHIGRHLQTEIKAFRAKLNVSRWGSIAACVLELLKVENALRYAWDLSKYKRVTQAAEREQQHSNSIDLTVVDSAITSPDFWASLRMMESIATVVQGCLVWIESCPCHYPLPHKEFPKKVRALWAKCPVRGCRAPELAHGELQHTLRELSTACASQLLAQLPNDITAESRALFLQDFERGRSHIVFIVNLRLDHWRQAPWCVFGCAHPDTEKSKACIERCLRLPADNKLVQELQAPDMREDIQKYLAGEELAQLSTLRNFLGKLYFCPIAERAIEGEHAQAGFRR